MLPARLKKNSFLRIFFITFFIFAGIYVFYFLSMVLPAARSAKALAKTKSDLESARLNLSQNSVLYYRFMSFDTGSLTLQDDKVELLSTLKKANDDALNFFSANTKKPSVFYTSKSTSEIVHSAYEKLNEDVQANKDVLTKQKSIIGKLEKADSILKNVFAYDTRYDFSDLSKYEVNAERAATARINLDKIKNNLESSGIPGKDVSVTNLESTINALYTLENAFGTQNDTLITNRLTALKNVLERTKGSAFELEKNIVKSPENLEYLKKLQENIKEYQLLIDEVSRLQNELNKDPLIRLFGNRIKKI